MKNPFEKPVNADGALSSPNRDGTTDERATLKNVKLEVDCNYLRKGTWPSTTRWSKTSKR